MRTLDLEEAAEFLRIHPHTLEAKARSGEINGAKPGKRWVFLDVDLADWLRSQYPANREKQECHSKSAAESGTVNGLSMARLLQKRLAQKIAKPPRNTTIDVVRSFGEPQS